MAWCCPHASWCPHQCPLAISATPTPTPVVSVTLPQHKKYRLRTLNTALSQCCGSVLHPSPHGGPERPAKLSNRFCIPGTACERHVMIRCGLMRHDDRDMPPSILLLPVTVHSLCSLRRMLLLCGLIFPHYVVQACIAVSGFLAFCVNLSGPRFRRVLPYFAWPNMPRRMCTPLCMAGSTYCVIAQHDSTCIGRACV